MEQYCNKNWLPQIRYKLSAGQARRRCWMMNCGLADELRNLLPRKCENDETATNTGIYRILLQGSASMERPTLDLEELKALSPNINTTDGDWEHVLRCWVRQDCGDCLRAEQCSWCPYVS